MPTRSESLLSRFRALRRAVDQSARSIGAHHRALPTFIIAGAQKGGTSSLFAHMVQHPHIVSPRTKEIHYFDLAYARGAIWYRSNFTWSSRLEATHSITGEASPYYMYHPLAPERIRALLPDVRLIFLLRNPVDRAISQYFHAVRWSQESLGIMDAFDAEVSRLAGEEDRIRRDPGYVSYSHQHHSYVDRGRYARQLERFFALFSRDQILVIPSERLYQDPRSVLREAFEHVGVDPGFAPADVAARNVGSYTRDVPDELRSRLIALFGHENRALAELVGTEMG
ncbi:MAG: sulfotransferase, partial [Spirochaetaceae bacterium]|nr:sulfotransferase [Spirochaetaceae bacterium]